MFLHPCIPTHVHKLCYICASTAKVHLATYVAAFSTLGDSPLKLTFFGIMELSVATLANCIVNTFSRPHPKTQNLHGGMCVHVCYIM